MENFFNYISKPLPNDEVEIWFRMNNIIPEKMELFSDFSQSLYNIMNETYLGDSSNSNETRITLTNDDKQKHFEWCWNKILDGFKKEGLTFKIKGEHFDYFRVFFDDIFYNQNEEKIKNSVKEFFLELFDINKPFTKSDLDMILIIYRALDKNMSL